MNEKEILAKLHQDFKKADESFALAPSKETEKKLYDISINLYEYVRELYGNKFMEKLYGREITEIVKLIEKQLKIV